MIHSHHLELPQLSMFYWCFPELWHFSLQPCKQSLLTADGTVDALGHSPPPQPHSLYGPWWLITMQKKQKQGRDFSWALESFRAEVTGLLKDWLGDITPHITAPYHICLMLCEGPIPSLLYRLHLIIDNALLNLVMLLPSCDSQYHLPTSHISPPFHS